MKHLAIYKCRLCKELDEIAFDLNTIMATMELLDPTTGGPVQEVKDADPLRLVTHHACNDDQLGIADFIGMRREE